MKNLPVARCFALCLSAAGSVALGQLTPAAVVRPFATGILQPVFVTAPSNQFDRVYVVDRTGRIQILSSQTGQFLGTFLDIRAITSTAGDGGLLCLAFSPNYASDGTFYVYHNDQPSADGVIARYRVSGNPMVADASSREVILKYPRPIGHNGGWLGFSPVDGMLHLAVGDGGTAVNPDPLNRSQNLVNSFFGKILRLDPAGDDFPADSNKNYRIPPGNPFINADGDDEVWAYGLRNPWRCSFDRVTGDLWIGDVGQDTYEEINVEFAGTTGGRNYGWKCLEGTFCTGFGSCDCISPMLTPASILFPHDGFNCSVTGGYVYRGSAIPSLQGLYICTDWCSARLWTVSLGPSGLPNVLDRTVEFQPSSAPQVGGIVSFGEDASGELYLCDFFGGKISKLVTPPCTPEFTQQPVPVNVPGGATVELNATCFAAAPLAIRWHKDGQPLSDSTRITGAATGRLTISVADSSDTGAYALVATSGCGSSSSVAAAVIVGFCPADWDMSGGVDGDDVITFFSDWDASAADFDGSGGTDGDDVIAFFARWDAGC